MLNNMGSGDSTHILSERQPSGNGDGFHDPDAKKIAVGEEDRNPLKKHGSNISVSPDSIDTGSSRHEYTKEDAQAYLDQLNTRYPIKEVVGEYYGNILRGESRHIFDRSFVADTTLEKEFYEMLQESLRAGEWVPSFQKRWGMRYINNHLKGDVKLEAILNTDTFGFFDPYPQAHQFLRDYAEFVFDTNPFDLIKRIKGRVSMQFQMNAMIQGMDEWSAQIFRNAITKTGRGESDDVFEFQTGIFPKEHFIQWLMQRLGTSIQEK